MRVTTLGATRARRGTGLVEPEELPSSQSVIACLRGEPGALAKTAMTTLLRTMLLLPGVYLAGGRGWRAWVGASAGSMTITAFLFFWYAAQERGRRDALRAPAPAPQLEPQVVDTTLADVL